MEFEPDPTEKRDEAHELSNIEFMDRSLGRLADEVVEKYAEISSVVTGMLFQGNLTREDEERLEAFETELKALDARWKRDTHAFDTHCTDYEKKYGRLPKVHEMLQNLYDRMGEHEEMWKRGFELVHYPHRRRKAMREASEEENPIEAMESRGLKASLEKRVETELYVLAQLEQIYDEITPLIAELPPEIGEPFGAKEERVQAVVWDRFAEARKLVYLYMFGHDIPRDGEENMSAALDIQIGRLEALGILKARGVITATEWSDWIRQSTQRSNRINEYISRTHDLQEKNMTRLMRKK